MSAILDLLTAKRSRKTQFLIAAGTGAGLLLVWQLMGLGSDPEQAPQRKALTAWRGEPGAPGAPGTPGSDRPLTEEEKIELAKKGLEWQRRIEGYKQVVDDYVALGIDLEAQAQGDPCQSTLAFRKDPQGKWALRTRLRWVEMNDFMLEAEPLRAAVETRMTETGQKIVFYREMAAAAGLCG